MLVAVDIDGTLSAHPYKFACMIAALQTNGDDVVLLTGGIVEKPNCDLVFQRAVSERREQVRPFFESHSFKVLDKVTIYPCLAKSFAEVVPLKGIYCRDNKVDILFDDSPSYCEAVKKLSPGTLVLKVM